MQPDIRFPNLGINLEHVTKGFDIFGFHIAWYGVIIAVGMCVGILLATRQAKLTGQDPDTYINFSLYAIIVSVIGARIYYVVFSWNEFSDDPLRIFNLRTGGLAIYGAVIAAVLCAWIYSKKKHIPFGTISDTCVPGLIAGQAIGRWGNFFNREAFGGYTDNLFAMQIKASDMTQGNLNPGVNPTVVEYHGTAYLQVHPTFLYESVWNVLVLILLLNMRRYQVFKGELLCWYLAGYGIGRFFIEGLRTDQLRIGHVAVSQALGMILFLAGSGIIIWQRLKRRKGGESVERDHESDV